MSIALPILAITFILLISSLNIAYDVEDDDYDPLMTKTTHMLVDYDLNLEIEKTDSDKIHKLIDKDDNISEIYKPTFLDPIRYSTNEKVFENHREEYIGLAINYSLENPKYIFYNIYLNLHQ